MKNYTSLLFFLLIAKALLLAIYISQGYIGLGPDEAQYWTWSKALDWGYYSKPPGIAFQIRLGTLFFGDSELGVRCGSLLLGALIPLAIYALAQKGNLTQQHAFWAALIMAFSPMGILASLFAITDVGMVFAWTLAALPLLGKKPNYLLAGLFIAFGALFKWPIYFFWIAVLIGMLLFKQWRHWSFIPGVALSLLGLIPVWIWNVQHDWVTFKHVGTTLLGGHAAEQGTTSLLKGNLLEFLGAQVLLLSPILFILLICAWVYTYRNWEKELPPLIRWGVATSFLTLIAFAGVSVFQKMQGNWCIFAYPLAIPAIAWISLYWTRIGLGLSFLFISAVLVLPLAQKKEIITFKANPFKHNLGWQKLSPLLSEEGYNPDDNFLFAETYQMTSILSFYGPDQKRAYFFNLQGARHNQFDIWPGMKEEQRGKTGYFIQVESKIFDSICDKQKQEELEKYFEKVECLGVFPLTANFNKYIRIWKCLNYNGKTPNDTVKY